MDAPDVNLRHFFALDEIASTGKLSAAAEQAFMSQSALTQALRKLETGAGVALFERSGFGVIPSAAGALLVRRARRAIALLSETEREIRNRHTTAATNVPLYRHVTMSQLRALIAVVDTGGYSTAARSLSLSQATVHRAAKQLEDMVGIGLFPRAARGVRPNEPARVLARCANLIFVEIRQGFEDIAELQGRTDGRIAVGSLPLVRSEFLPLAVTRLLEKYPDAKLSILDGPYVEQLHALRYGQIDWLIGALRDPPPTHDIAQESLFMQSLSIVVRPGHPLLQNSPPTLRDLAKLEWVTPQKPAPARKIFESMFERAGLDVPTRVVECSSLIATQGIVLNSDRAALLSPLQIREGVHAGDLAILVNAIPDSRRTIGITTRDDWVPTLLQQEFTKILRSLAAAVDKGQPS